MSTWILADTHLDHTGAKPMSIFGPIWNNHPEVLAEHWQKLIKPEDNVIIAGDISWAMQAEDAVPDLTFLNQLPGLRKILLKGNHDFWWSTKSKVNKLFQENSLDTLEIMQNEAKLIRNPEEPDEDFILVGSRGWKLPTDNDADAKDKKVYKREKNRFLLSLQDVELLKKRESETRDLPVVAVFHYPPLNKFANDSELTAIIESAGIRKVYYGHVHKQHGLDNLLCFEGEKNGVSYKNIALDFIECVPVRVEV